MDSDPYEKAIDRILEGADGDARLALRTLLIQIMHLEARCEALQTRAQTDLGKRNEKMN
jgi:hypothetical protein